MQSKTFVIALSTCFACAAAAEELTSVSKLTIEVEATCIFDNGSGGSDFGTLFFGSHVNLNVAIDAQSTPTDGSIGFKCSPDVPYRIELDDGQNASGPLQRQLRNTITNEAIRYELFQDAQFSQPWNSSNAVTGVGTGQFEWVTLYGRIPASANLPSAGEYRDQLAVTLFF